jgi:hypothetical protein
MPKRVKQNRSMDVNQTAQLMVSLSTEETEQGIAGAPKPRKKKPPAAVSEYMAKIGSKGGRISGKRRIKNLSAEQRREIARKGANARWKKPKPIEPLRPS